MNNKSKKQKVFYYLKHNPLEILAYGFMKSATFLPDETYLKILFRLKMGYKLNLNNPKSFNQKLQWLKIHDRRPEYPKMVDKYDAKVLAAKIISDVHIVPNYGVWDDFEQIDFDTLPNQFVLKKTDGCGNREVIICKDKSTFDRDKTRRILGGNLKTNRVYKNFREWPYKSIRPRIIAEKLLVDGSGAELKDYKFYCFNGEPKICLIASDRNTEGGPYFDYFDMDFNHLPYRQSVPNAPFTISKPIGFDEMKDLARTLSQGMIHVRIDLYNVDGEIYFGEWTLYDSSGFEKFYPQEWDFKVGDLMQLPK